MDFCNFFYNSNWFNGINNWFMPNFGGFNLSYNFDNSFSQNQIFMPEISQFQSFQNFSMPDFSMPIQTMSSFSAYDYMSQPASFNFSCGVINPFNVGNFALSSNHSDKTPNVDSQFKVSDDNIVPEGYNAQKGEMLAQIAYDNRNTSAVNKNGKETYFLGQCGKFVRQDLEKAGLYNGMKGKGYEYLDILRKNNNFKEVSFTGDEYKSMPPGCIYVYDKGVSGCSEKFGHVQIGLGNSKAVSDGIDENVKRPTAIFMPV